MYQDLLDKARQVDADFRQWVEIVGRYDHLSGLGKDEEIAKHERNRSQKIAELQDEARRRLEADRKRIAGELAKEREAEVERRRAILGDVVFAGIYEKRLSKMPSGAILEAYQEAAGDWEKTIIGEYGAMIIEERVFNQSSPAGDDFLAYNVLTTKPTKLRDLEVAAHDFRRGEEFVESLDLSQWRQSMADRLGLQVETLTEVEPTF